jgi:pSer/pThr/pTyr-binding forkhead associated (FHA) protein
VNRDNDVSTSPHISVTLMSGPRDGDTFYFQPNTSSLVITFGRREGCDICLSYDSQVSRLHAQVVFDDELFWLEDLGSRNGTFVFGEQLHGRIEIRPGVLFKVGRTWLRIDPRRADETQIARPVLDDDSLDPFF